MKHLNLYDKNLKLCSKNPLTGSSRDGYCKPIYSDLGNHLVCSKTDKQFLNYTAKKGNDLRSLVKPGDKWCLCQNRYLEAAKAGKAPKIVNSATSNKVRPDIKKIITKQNKIKKKGGKLSKKNKKQRFLYNPDNPKLSFDVYIDKNPNDTITIKYTTCDDIKNTIKKLEKLYKTKKYPHKRIWQVGMIMKVRMQAMLKHKKTRYKKAKNVKTRYTLTNRYFKFLKNRTKKSTFNERKKMVFS